MGDILNSSQHVYEKRGLGYISLSNLNGQSNVVFIKRIETLVSPQIEEMQRTIPVTKEKGKGTTLPYNSKQKLLYLHWGHIISSEQYNLTNHKTSEENEHCPTKSVCSTHIHNTKYSNRGMIYLNLIGKTSQGTHLLNNGYNTPGDPHTNRLHLSINSSSGKPTWDPRANS